MSDWDHVASTRYRQIESGLDITFLKIFVPFYSSIIAKLSPSSLLEVGSGTGHLLKIFSDQMVDCTGIEPSRAMHDFASKVLSGTSVKLENIRIQDFQSAMGFDLILSHLCFQVIADLDAVLRVINRVLNAQGAMVFSIPHPCFWNDYQKFIPDDEYRYMVETAVVARLTISNDRATTMSVPYIHRSLGQYFDLLAKRGFWMDTFHEVYPSPDVMKHYGSDWNAPRYLTIVARKK